MLTRPAPTTATRRVSEALAALADTDRPEAWISLADPAGLLAEAAEIDRRVAAGEALQLAGTVWAVKDNIDVAGLATTAACPEFAYHPDHDAEVVRRIRAQGGVILGKTNLDQFATGLVGTRSPYGAVRCVTDETLISGGSSSGSAVALAQGIVDYSLGTDTAGSGRVPAGFNGIVGIKPTLGLVSSRGVVPACRSYDTVSLFAADLASVPGALRVLIGPDAADPRSRGWAEHSPAGAPAHPRLLIPTDADLQVCSDAVREGFNRLVADLTARGIQVESVELEVLLDAARLLYDGGLVAERAEAYGEWAQAHLDALDPTVAGIVTRAGDVPGWQVIRDQHRVLAARHFASTMFEGADALIVPTAPMHPSIAAVQADPVGINTILGTFTNFVNLLDMCAVAAPAADGTAVTVIAPACHDQVALDVAGLISGAGTDGETIAPGEDIVVFGEHQRGLALQYQLEQAGGRFMREAATAPEYRMHLVETGVPRPALRRVEAGGCSLPGEVWRVPALGLARLLRQVVAPLALGPVTLEAGQTAIGFVGAGSVAQLPDITAHGGWRGYLAARR
ncbi:MAG: allophanate hydrolase [Arachnia sp.]